MFLKGFKPSVTLFTNIPYTTLVCRSPFTPISVPKAVFVFLLSQLQRIFTHKVANFSHVGLALTFDPWSVLQICLSLVRLLHFLAHSPLGPVTLLDFRPRQFVLVGGELKVTDLDDASVEETPCGGPVDCLMEFPARNFTLPCIRGRCQGINEKRNLYNAYR